jgi:hypothetical protein
MGANDGFEGIARGIAAAAAEAGDRQLELLDLAPPIRSTGGQADLVRAQIAEAARVRGRGRPPGAQNLLTKQAKEWIARVVGDPLIESARWLLHTPDSLAKELSCTLLEAFKLQQAIREGIMPYMHSKLAPVGEDGRPLPMFQLIMGGAEGLDAGTVAPWLNDPEVARTLELEDERNQGVSVGAGDQSQTSESQR